MSLSSPKGSPKRPQTIAELGELQRLAAKIIMRPLDDAWRTQRRWIDGRDTGEIAAKFIKPSDRLTSFERIEIYNKQYWFRLSDVLYDDFLGLRRVLGDEQFNRIVRAYLSEYPSQSYTLRNLGNRLEKFLLEHPELAGDRQELAVEMTRLEWASTVAFDEREEPPISVDDLLGQDPNRLRLGLQPHLTLLALNYPLDEFSMAMKKRERENSAARLGKRRAMRPPMMPRRKKIFLAVHRHDHSVYFKRMGEAEFAMLAALRDGATLGKACEAAVRAVGARRGNIALKIQAFLQNSAALGWFCRASQKAKCRPSREQSK